MGRPQLIFTIEVDPGQLELVPSNILSTLRDMVADIPGADVQWHTDESDD